MLTDAEMHERMVNGWRAGLPWTVCGNGSLPEHTAKVRRTLPEWCRKYGLRIVNDAGAGDMKWRRGMVWDVEYHPFDLIPRHESVTKLDFTTERMPDADLIVCRMVLNHLDEDRIQMALDQFRQSAPYLAATQFQGENLPQRSTQFMRLDLRKWLGEPIESVQDGSEDCCSLALWRLERPAEPPVKARRKKAA